MFRREDETIRNMTLEDCERQLETLTIPSLAT
jgi:hypothetical protein